MADISRYLDKAYEAKEFGELAQQRGGTQAAKEDAQELRDISQEQGSATDKAKAAAAAIREPGAHHPDAPDAGSQGAGDVPQQN